MFRGMTLRGRMLSTGLALLLVPLAVIFGVVVVSEVRMREATSQEVRKLAVQDLDHLVQGIEAMCLTQQAVLEDAVERRPGGHAGDAGAGPVRRRWAARRVAWNGGEPVHQDGDDGRACRA